jgi:hypothetical protein
MSINAGLATPLSTLNRTWNIDSVSTNYFSLVNPEPLDAEHVRFTRQ